MSRKYEYTSDVYGTTPFTDDEKAFRAMFADCFPEVEVTRGYTICDCGAAVDTILADGELVAVESGHTDHQPW